MPSGTPCRTLILAQPMQQTSAVCTSACDPFLMLASMSESVIAFAVAALGLCSQARPWWTMNDASKEVGSANRATVMKMLAMDTRRQGRAMCEQPGPGWHHLISTLHLPHRVRRFLLCELRNSSTERSRLPSYNTCHDRDASPRHGHLRRK